MWRYPLSIALLLVAITAPSVHTQTSAKSNKREAKTVAAIRAVLDAQRAAWNRGDVAGYMDGYARSRDTIFVSGDTVTRGWQTVLDRYKKNYDSREKMGTLTFSEVEIRPMGNNSAVVLGRWHLKRANDEPHGRFTLIFRRTREGWRIVHDHTS
jgi:uncharacterized protein (TIGR02246 family)